MSTPPKLWWSPTLGLITEAESRITGEILLWVINDSKTSLRRALETGEDSNPPLPKDAVALTPFPEPAAEEDEHERVEYLRQRVLNVLMESGHAANAYLHDAFYHAEVTFFWQTLTLVDHTMREIGHSLAIRDALVDRLLASDGVVRPNVEHAQHRVHDRLRQLNDQGVFRFGRANDLHS